MITSLYKLLKYDLLFAKNGFFGLAAALLSVSIVFRFTLDFFSDSIIPLIGATITMWVVHIIVSIMSIIFIFQGFSKTFFGDTGYLMFTLPVKRWMLLRTKIITSLIWLNFMALVGFIQANILTFDHGGQLTFDQANTIGIFALVHFNVLGFLALSILFMIITLSKAYINGRNIHFIFSAIIGAIYFAIWAQIITWFFRHVADFGYFGIGVGRMYNWVDFALGSSPEVVGYLVVYDFVFIGSAILFGIGACFIILKLFKYMELR